MQPQIFCPSAATTGSDIAFRQRKRGYFWKSARSKTSICIHQRQFTVWCTSASFNMLVTAFHPPSSLKSLIIILDQKHDTSAASSAPKPEQRLSPSASASGSGSASDSVNSSRLANLPGANPAYSSSIFRISKCLSQLPKYLKPLPSHLGFDENSYLAAKGALSLPESAVIEQILRAFAQWHFPLMPVVDIDFILRAVLQDNQNAKISLLMLQAVIYAGSAHVDLAWLRKAGYADRKAARTAFYHRTRVQQCVTHLP